MKKTTKKIWNITSWVLIFLVLVLAILTAGIKLVGITPYAVLSGSMEPAYHVGSLIYDVKADAKSIKTGDAITFTINNGKTLATHRVAEINKDAKTFTTKGDANESADSSPVSFKSVVGKPIFTIPLLGYFTNWISTLSGKIIAATVGIIFIIFLLLPDVLEKAEKSDKKTPPPAKTSPQKEN